MKTVMFMLAIITCLSTAGCSEESFEKDELAAMPGNVILEWNEVAYEAFGGETYQHSLMASRINAMMHLAMHDAVNAVNPQYSSYCFTGKDSKAHPIAAATSAAYTVLVNELPDRQEFLDSALHVTLSTIPEGDAKKRGIALGKAAAMSLLGIRSNDGSADDPIVPVNSSDIAGTYQAVPPFDFIFAPNWTDVKPFGLAEKFQFRSPMYPLLTTTDYSDAYNEVKEMGAVNSTIRTTEQTAYMNYWYEFSEAGWNRVARTVAQDMKLNLVEAARLFALVDMAIADAYIAGWDSKFHYNLWRPFTAIRKAYMDENERTVEDVQWEPALPTPPVQDYPSTHSALGNAAATVLSNILGDNTPFTMSSPTGLPGKKIRSYSSFHQAADENADSRVMAGIHFRFACEAGQQMGNAVGQWLFDNYLQPIR